MKKTAILIASLILLTSFLYLLSQNASWERQVQQEVKQVRKSHKWTSSFFILEICKLKADYFNFSNLSNGRKSYLGHF
jgi:hypothetical protein